MHDRDLSPIAVVSDFPFRGEEVGGAWKTMDVASKHTITVLYTTLYTALWLAGVGLPEWT
jgi:hypothetical protein